MLNVTIRQLKVFESVARNLSYTRAAEELHLTQPAVSMQIKQLESAIDHPVLEQFGKKNYLTAAGKEMQFYASEILRLLDESENVLLDLKGVKTGVLDIAVATTANDFATRILASFSKIHEGIRIRLDVTNRKKLLEQLQSNEKDLVIMGRPPREMDIETEAIMDNPLVVIASPNHPLANQKQISISEVIKFTFVIREQASGTRIAVEKFFSKHNLDMTSRMEMTSNEAIKQAVQAGLGLGIVSIHTVGLEIEAGKLVVLDIKEFPIIRHWYVVYKKGKRLSAVANEFKEYVLQKGASFVYTPNMGDK